MAPNIATWIVSAFAVGGVIVRPFEAPEALWAVSGAAILVVFGLITPALALAGIAKGADVYLFIAGALLFN